MDSSARWQRSGVLFDNVAIRPEAPAAGSGTEEFTFVAPLPGCAGDDTRRDGKANPMIVYRLFLKSHEPLN
jgi:hypothetical protein